jgi:hypothetical protein
LAPGRHWTLDYLFRHQLLNQFRFEFDWNENDLLIWDHLRTIRRAIADHGPGEIRLMRRCQVMASNVFDRRFRGRHGRPVVFDSVQRKFRAYSPLRYKLI